MGLDMYLYANKYISKAEWRGEEASKQFDEIVKIMQADEFVRKDLPSGSVNFQVAYWRKANQIHGWFVRNVQDDTDDCGSYEVGRDDLQALVDVCRKVLANRKLAAKLLPPAEGFFFGRYEYDDSYFADVQDTADKLAALLEALPEDSGWCFEYQSSW